MSVESVNGDDCNSFRREGFAATHKGTRNSSPQQSASSLRSSHTCCTEREIQLVFICAAQRMQLLPRPPLHDSGGQWSRPRRSALAPWRRPLPGGDGKWSRVFGSLEYGRRKLAEAVPGCVLQSKAKTNRWLAERFLSVWMRKIIENHKTAPQSEIETS